MAFTVIGIAMAACSAPRVNRASQPVIAISAPIEQDPAAAQESTILSKEWIVILDTKHYFEYASLQVANSNSSEDAPVFSLSVFDDGCYVYIGNFSGHRAFSTGRISKATIERIVHDAESFGFQQFAEDLHFEDGIGPDLALTIQGEGWKKTVTCTLIVDEDRAKAASRAGSEFALQSAVSNLLLQRVLDVAPEMR